MIATANVSDVASDQVRICPWCHLIVIIIMISYLRLSVLLTPLLLPVIRSEKAHGTRSEVRSSPEYILIQ